MLFDAEGCACLLHCHTQHYIQILGFRGGFLVVFSAFVKAWVVSVLHIRSSIFAIKLGVDALLCKLLVELVNGPIFSGEINHRAGLAFAVNHKQRRYAGCLSHLGVVGTERGRDVHNTRTIFGGYIIAGYYAKRIGFFHFKSVAALCHRLNPREQLSILHAQHIFTSEFGNHAIRHNLFARLVGVERHFGSLCSKVGIQACLGKHKHARSAAVRIVAFNSHIFDFLTHAQRSVRRQSPRRGGPSQDAKIIGKRFMGSFNNAAYKRMLGVGYSKSCSDGGVLHVAVATRLIQLVRAQTCTGGRRIRLNSVALIQQTFLIELLQKPPQRFDIAVFVGDIRMVEVNPISHLVGKVGPLAGVLHHLAAAGSIIVVNRNLLANVFFGDAKALFHAQLHWQAMGVPTGFAHHTIALHGLVAAHHILYGARHHMMNARHAISRRRSFEKDKRWMPLALVDAACKHVLGIPLLQHCLVNLR